VLGVSGPCKHAHTEMTVGARVNHYDYVNGAVRLDPRFGLRYAATSSSALTLSVGRYHLKIQVRDETSGAESEESIGFEMVADPKLAASVPRR